MRKKYSAYRFVFFATCVTLLLFLQATVLPAQENQQLDSLQQRLKLQGNDTTKVALLNEIAFELSSTGSVVALQYSRQAITLGNKLKFGSGVARAYNNMGLYYDYLGNYDSAMFYYNESVEQNREINDKNALAGNYLNIGGSYLYQGLYKPALEYTIKAYRLYSVLGNEKRMVSCLNNMGIIYRATKEYKKALVNYTEVLKIRKRKNDLRGLMVTYTNIGVVYQNLKDYHNFLAYTDTSLQLAKKVGNVNDISGTMLNIGLAYIRLKRYADAEKIINETLLLVKAANDVSNEAYAYAALGELELEQKNFSRSLVYFQQAEFMAKALKRVELLKNLYGYQYSAHKQLKHFDEALRYLELDKTLNDSLLNQETIRQTNEIDAIYKTAEKEKENQRLKTENEVQKVNAEWSNVQRNIFIVAAVVTLILLLFILRAYVAKRRTNVLLEKNKELVENSLQEKETLLKEIHHRVKNNLQIISSLLELQLNRINDEQISALLRESKNRIESMAIIHKKLYSHNNFAQVDVAEYVKDLVMSLRSSYLKPGATLDIKFDIDEFALNTETAVPLGLIMTEVMSNAFKYAVRPDHGNLINISIKKMEQNRFRVQVQDNGPGIHTNAQVSENDSLGLKLVKILSKQLEGESRFEQNNGLLFTLTGKIIG